VEEEEANDDDSAAASEARLCGAIDTTGILRAVGGSKRAFSASALRTSVCDCNVIRTDSAEVMQPLHARQSFRLICA
jgi:hypothetical protein